MDKTLKCVDCGADFVFTTGEQEFYASQGFTSEPRRCPSCRAARKGAQGGARPPRSGAETPAPNPNRPMYSAVCAECGKETKVPFQPTNGRPVYCSDCYRNNGGARSGGSRSGGYQQNRSHAPSSRPTAVNTTPSFEPSDFDFSSFADMYPPPNPGRNKRRERREKERSRDRDNW